MGRLDSSRFCFFGWQIIVSYFDSLSYSFPSTFYYSFVWSYVPMVVGGVIFMLIGWYMMKSGVKKELASRVRYKSGLKLVGYSLTMLGTALIIAGIFAGVYSKISSTPDPPFFYGTIYPYAPYSGVLLIAGFIILIIGITLLWTAMRIKDSHK